MYIQYCDGPLRSLSRSGPNETPTSQFRTRRFCIRCDCMPASRNRCFQRANAHGSLAQEPWLISLPRLIHGRCQRGVAPDNPAASPFSWTWASLSQHSSSEVREQLRLFGCEPHPYLTVSLQSLVCDLNEYVNQPGCTARRILSLQYAQSQFTRIQRTVDPDSEHSHK